MANPNIYDNKLTPSAKEALANTLAEFEEMLLNKANLIAQKGQTADKEISLRDVLEAKENLFKIKIDQEKFDYRRKRLMTVISLTGALYTIFGFIFYLYQNNNFSLEKDAGLVIAFTGILTIVLGYTYIQFIYRQQEERQKNIDFELKSENDDFEVIKRWQIIEKLGSNLMRQKGYSNNESKSINDILRFLSVELKSDQLYTQMRELLSIRNKILHEGHQLSRHDKQSYVNMADEIIGQLEKHEK